MDKYYSIYQGIVVDIKDPLKIGRCRIKVPSVHGNISKSDYNLLPWAIYRSPYPSGSGRSSFILPKVGDVVWVEFINGDKRMPSYSGSSFANKEGTSEVPVSESEYGSTDVVYSSDGAIIKKTSNELRLEYNGAYISLTSTGEIILKGVKIHLN